MADREAVLVKEVGRQSSDIDIDGSELPTPGPPRRDSTSTTDSGRPIPPGNWTLPISGNCPRCRHHHRSIKIHVKDINNSSRLVDLHCENCDKLWIGPGNGNSTRVSLASNETLEPPPTEPEILITLAHMVRFANRVATLSPNLPNIPELASTAPSRGSFFSGPVGSHAQRIAASQIYRGPDTGPNIVPRPSITQPAIPSANRIVKPNAHSTRQPRFILRIKRRIGGTFPMLKTTRIGRLMKLSDENETSTTDNKEQSTSDPILLSDFTSLHTPNLPGIGTEAPHQNLIEAELSKNNVPTPPAVATQCLGCGMFIDQEVVNAMNQEQRIALLRSQKTIFSAQHNAHPDAVLKPCVHDCQEHPLESVAAMAALHNYLLAGIGNGSEQYSHWEGNFNPNRSSLSISETRMSEAGTVVEGQKAASDRFMREVLQRERRLSGSARPWSMYSNTQQTSRDRRDIRSSVDSAATTGVRSLTPVRARTFDRRSRQSMIRSSMLYNTEASASQPRLRPLGNNDTEHDPQRSTPLTLPSRQERRISA